MLLVLIIIEIPFSSEASSHAFASLGFLHAAFLTGLEINGVLFDFFDDGFLLDFPFEPLQSLFDRFSIFNDDKCQKYHLLDERVSDL